MPKMPTAPPVIVQVQRQHAQDLDKGDRRQRQVDAAQAQRRHADEDRQHARGQPGDQPSPSSSSGIGNGCPGTVKDFGGHNGGDIAAQRIEAGLASDSCPAISGR